MPKPASTPEDTAEQREETTLGPPHFEVLFAAQVEPKRFEFSTTVEGKRVDAFFVVKKLNENQHNRWMMAGATIDRETKDLRLDPNESNELLLELSISDFAIPNGLCAPNGDPVVKKFSDFDGGTKRILFLRGLLPPVAKYIVDCCRGYNGYNEGNEAGVE